MERSWYQPISEEQNLLFLLFWNGVSHWLCCRDSPLTPDPLASLPGPSLVVEFHVLPWLLYKRKIFPQSPSKIKLRHVVLGAHCQPRQHWVLSGKRECLLGRFPAEATRHKVTYSSPKESHTDHRKASYTLVLNFLGVESCANYHTPRKVNNYGIKMSLTLMLESSGFHFLLPDWP